MSSIGKAAHITAAAPGGPRFDPTLSKEQRAGIANGIWLCANCADKIDRDVSVYTTSQLEHWKCLAEARARNEQGKTLPSPQELEALQAALYRKPLANSVTTALGSLSKNVGGYLEGLDPRFKIDVGYQSGETNILVSSRVPEVTLSLEVAPPHKAEFDRKWASLLDHGEQIQFDGGEVSFKGSPLFDALWAEGGRLEITPQRRTGVIQKTYFVRESGRIDAAIDDFVGELSGGAKSATFNGSNCGGIFSVEFRRHWSNNPGSITFGLDFKKWQGLGVEDLPYLDKVFAFVSGLKEGERVRITLEVDGNGVLTGNASGLDRHSEIRSLYSILRYLRNVRDIAVRKGLRVAFDGEFDLDYGEMNDVEYFWNILFEYASKKGVQIGPVGCEIVPIGTSEAERIRSAVQSKMPGPFKIRTRIERSINLLGVVMAPPMIEIDYSNVVMSLKSGSEEAIQEGSELRVLLMPTENCEVLVTLVDG